MPIFPRTMTWLIIFVTYNFSILLLRLFFFVEAWKIFVKEIPHKACSSASFLNSGGSRGGATPGGGGGSLTIRLTGGLTGGVQCPGSSRVLDALSCNLSLILPGKHSDTKLKRKEKHSRSKFRGRARLLRPLWIRHCSKIKRLNKLCAWACHLSNCHGYFGMTLKRISLTSIFHASTKEKKS